MTNYVYGGGSRIEEYSATGGFIKDIGSKGSGSGQLNGPLGIASIRPATHARRGSE